MSIKRNILTNKSNLPNKIIIISKMWNKNPQNYQHQIIESKNGGTKWNNLYNYKIIGSTSRILIPNIP